MQHAYKCDHCSFNSPDAQTVIDHEAVPLTGLDLQVGQIFGIESREEPFTSGGTIDDLSFHFPIAVVLGGPTISEGHQKNYDLRAYQIYKHPSGYSVTEQNLAFHVAPTYQVNFQDEFRELTGEEYALALNLLTTHAQLNDFNHTEADKIRAAVETIEFSQGKLPVKVEVPQ